MGIFSKFFNKKEPEPESESEAKCSLRFTLHDNEDVGFECEWDEESVFNLAQLIYLVNNGFLAEEILKIIKDSCIENDNEKDYIRLLGFLQIVTSGQALGQDGGKNPLVKPTQVIGTSLDDTNIPI